MDERTVQGVIYLAPIVISLTITLGLSLLAFRRRRVNGGLQFGISLLLESLWIGGYMLGLISPTLEGKIFWENIQYISTLFGPLMILVFAFTYCGHAARFRWKLWLGLLLPILAGFILSITNPQQVAIQNQRLIPGEPFGIYAYDFGIPVYAVLFYDYCLLFWAIYLLFQLYSRQDGLYRRQTGFVLAGIVIPMISSFTIFFDLPFLPQRDISPYYFVIADLFIAYGLFYYHLFDIVPFARDQVMEHMEDGVLIVDPLGRLLDLNPAAKNLLGITGDKAIGQPLSTLLPGGTASADTHPAAQSFRSEISLKSGGEWKTIDLHATRLPGQRDAFAGFMLILRDISVRKQQEDELRHSQDVLEQRVNERTADLAAANQRLLAEMEQRKQAEQARLESETRFHTLAELLPQSIFECDLSGQLTYANRKAFETFGYAQLEPGMRITDLVIESQRELAGSRFRRILENRVETYREYTAQCKDGSTLPVMVYAAAMVENGRPVGLRGIVVDISERKNVEEALRSSEEKFRSIIEQSSEGIMLVGEDGLVLELNRAFEHIYGISRTNILNRPFWEMTRQLGYLDGSTIDPQGDAQQDYQEILQSGFGDRTITEETEFITPDGRRRVIQRTAFPVVVSQGRRMAAVVSDITERKNAEQEQRRLNRTLTMISACNQALIRMDDESTLLQTICSIIVEIGSYRFAWVGFFQDSADHTIHPISSSGAAGDFLERLVMCEETPEARCLRRFLSASIPASLPTIVCDTQTDPIFAPYRDEFVKRGFLSVLIFPLVFGTELYGSLNIYAGESRTPDQNELNLLTEMVNNVSFGIHAFRMNIDRDRAELKAHNAIMELNQAYEATLEGWSHALELRERETAGHCQRVVALTLAIAKRMGVADEHMVHIRRGALLHDIGKMGIPDHILLKPEPLSEEEWIIMRQHPHMAYRLLSGIPYLGPALDIPYCHHEFWDGGGYPRGLKGEEIPLAARIFAVVDVWDALIYDRPYRPAWMKEEACAYLQNRAGQQFDPRVVEEFLALVRQISDPLSDTLT